MASKEQRELMADFYNNTCFEFMYKDEVRANDPAGFVELWDRNIKWLDDNTNETDRMINDYKRKHEV